jgi:hypothetical protein
MALFRPRDWSPLEAEPIVYLPPNGDRARSGLYVRPGRSHHHYIWICFRGNLEVDRRDLYPMPNWRDYHAMEAMERAEEPEPDRYP